MMVDSIDVSICCLMLGGEGIVDVVNEVDVVDLMHMACTVDVSYVTSMNDVVVLAQAPGNSAWRALIIAASL